jgi:hypothetical protein
VFWLLATVLSAAPQAKVIRAETFVSSGATEKDATAASSEVKSALAKQGYQLDDKAAEFVVSGVISKAAEKLIIDTQLSRADDHTLVASAHVVCVAELKACAKDAAEQLGSKLRETTGVRVKLKAK